MLFKKRFFICFSTPTFGVNLLYQVYQSRCWQRARRAAAATPWWPQTAPAGFTKDPLQDTAQPSSQLGGTFVKTLDKQGNEGGESEEQQYEHQSQKIRKGRRGSRHHQSRYSPAAHGENQVGADIHTVAHTGAVGYVLKELQLMRNPYRSRGKAWEGRSRRKKLLQSDRDPHPPLMGPSREEIQDSGVNLIQENESQWEGVILIFGSHYPKLF